MKLKRILLVMILCIIIIILSLICILYRRGVFFGDDGEIINYEESQIERVADSVKFFNVKNCITQFLSITNIENSSYYGYDDSDNYVKIIDEDIIKENMYSLLSNKYIEDNNISIDNVYKYVDVITENRIFIPIQMKYLCKENTEKYLVYGIETSINNEYIKDLYLFVNLDYNNNSFSIEPINKKINFEEYVFDNENKPIESNNNNTFMDEKVNYEYICKEYINYYSKISLAKPELAYQLLDEDYRKARYGSLESFKEYIKDNKDIITSVSLSQYQVTEEESSREYICIDKNGFYYIFREKYIMDFTVITDTHTINLPQFIEKYNKATTQEKVSMNINKIIEALNMKDYGYVYDKFSNGFKSNYFKTKKDFIEFAKKHFVNNNNITYNKYSETSNDTYVYNITLKDKNGRSDLEINMDILMKLKGDIDFIITFSGMN